MSLENIKGKITKNLKERFDLELEKQKLEKAERQRQEVQYKREQQKRQAQIDYENDLRERQRHRDQIEYEKTPEAKLQLAKQHAELNLRRDREISGLSEEEIKVKYMDKNARIDYINKKAQKDTDSKLSKIKSAINDMY